MLGFAHRYIPDYLKDSRFGELQTPVQIVLKNKNPIRWVYEISDLKLKAGEQGKYMKGLGSYTEKNLRHIVKTDGIENMINMFNLDDASVLDDWLSGSKADVRKEYLQNNTFDISEV